MEYDMAETDDNRKQCENKSRDSGQALVEFAVGAMLLATIVFAMIDSSRAIFDMQVMAFLSGQGSNLASRGTALSDTATAVVAASASLNLSTNGKVIVTSVYNNNGALSITGQSSLGSMSATSKVGTGVGSSATLPSNAIPPTAQTVYVTEVFYSFQAITPMGHLYTKTLLPSTLYDVAYY